MIILPDGKRLPTVTPTGIYGFFGDYRFLSNFHVCSVRIESITYPSSEHAYMAQKTLNRQVREEIANLKTPRDARNYGQTVPLRAHWDDYRPVAMYRVLRCKFTQNHELAQKLVDTGNKILEETNNWNDTYWGVCNGVGQSMLGKMLMCVRDELTGG